MELDYVKLKEIKPALTGNIREATNLLSPDFFPDEKTIHDVRVLMNVLKLISPQLDAEFVAREKPSTSEG